MVRFIPKQFAENSTTSVVFGSHQEQGGKVGDGTISSDPATLQGGAAWPLGWKAATDNFFQIPRGEEIEGLERVLSASIIQQFKDGLTFWQSEMPVTQYQTIVQYQTGSDLPKLYINITGTSTSTPPDSDTTNWFMFFDTAQVSANVALTNSPYTTNRILEIPQDIKLELSNGTLTLKAGSKVYVPNGFESDGTTPKFDVVTIESDFTKATYGFAVQTLAFVNPSHTAIDDLYTEQCHSGTVAPTATPVMIWYDTANNLVKITSNSGSTWTSGYSLPIGLVTSTTTAYSAIDQIFNGFGYIGSTVFTLPGVKVQAPNGKNKDGTCNSSVYTISTVLTMPIEADWGTFDIYLTSTRLGKWPNVISGSVGTRYNSENNYYEVYSAGQSKWVPLPSQLAIAKVKADTTSPYRITSFEPYTVDSVANSNLSNLSATGEAHFANPALTNLSAGLSNTICTTAATTTSSASSARPAVVVRNYRSGENWYRVWSDGWIEQGGAQTNTSGGSTATLTISLIKAFTTTTYTVMRAPVWGSGWGQAGADGYTTGIFSRTTTSFSCATHASSSVSKIMWYACGY